MDESVAAGAPPVRLRAVPGSGGHLFSLLVECFGVNGPRPVVVRSPGDIRQSTDAFRRRVRCGSRRAARSGSGRGVGRCASGPARVRQRGGLCTRWRLPASGGGATPRWSQFPGSSLNARESGGKVVRVDSARTGEPPTRLVMANWRRKLEPYPPGQRLDQRSTLDAKLRVQRPSTCHRPGRQEWHRASPDYRWRSPTHPGTTPSSCEPCHHPLSCRIGTVVVHGAALVVSSPRIARVRRER